MGKIIAFTNQKGGVGKTTSAVNVAASLGILGKKVLLVDLDPQGSATTGVGIARKGLDCSMRDVFKVFLNGESEQRKSETIIQCIKKTEFENLSVMPSIITLSDVEFQLYKDDQSPYFLKDALECLKVNYDYIIIDCPPSLGMLTVNGLTASDAVIIPMQCEFYSLEGLSQLMISISGIRKNFNADINVCGILLTMYSGRFILTMQVVNELKKHYGNKLFNTKISRGVKLSEAPSFGCPVYYHDKTCKGAKEYLDVAQEIIERI